MIVIKNEHIQIIAIIFIFILFPYLIYNYYNSSEGTVEAFELSDKPLETTRQIYDNFYASIYDLLTKNTKKSTYEISSIIDSTIKNVDNPLPKNEIKFLDAGCGTGNAASIVSKLYPVTCLDKSKDMLNIAKKRQQEKMTLIKGDLKDRSTFDKHKFSHIMSLYFTIYYFRNIDHIFENFAKWVIPNGYVIIHLVDKKAFNPIINPASERILNDVQSYSKKRKTDSIVVFKNFTYTSDFKLENSNKAVFEENFIFKDGTTRSHRHHFYMYDKSHYVKTAKKYGFSLHDIRPQTMSGYAHHYLFIFKKTDTDQTTKSLQSISG